MSMRVWSYFNLRTFLALALSQLAAFITIYFQLKFNFSLMLFSLAVAFPLHFSIQASFKRRDRALEYFGKFKGGMMALFYSVKISKDLSPEKKLEGSGLLKEIANNLTRQLQNHEGDFSYLQQKFNALFNFMEENRSDLSNRNCMRMIRYLGTVTEASVFLLSLVTHRTMAGLRFYSTFFVLIFPFVQTPILLHRLDDAPGWVIHLIVAFTTLILVTLTNFQKMIEYPFDERGVDNVHLQDYKMDV